MFELSFQLISYRFMSPIRIISYVLLTFVESIPSIGLCSYLHQTLRGGLVHKTVPFY